MKGRMLERGRRGWRWGLEGFLLSDAPKGKRNRSYGDFLIKQTIKFGNYFLKWKFWLGTVLHIFNPSVREPGAEGLEVKALSGYTDSLSLA